MEDEEVDSGEVASEEAEVGEVEGVAMDIEEAIPTEVETLEEEVAIRTQERETMTSEDTEVLNR